jgi:hypothetical protein
MKNCLFPTRPTLLLGLAALVLGGCADAVVKKAWTAPAVGSIKFTKVFVLAVTPNDIHRRLAEIAVKSQITRIPAVGSYEFLPDISDTKVKAKVLQAIKDSQADGLVVLRLFSKDTKVISGSNTALPMEYAAFSDYYGTVYDVGAYFATDSRALYTDTIFGIETNIYDAKTDKLVWSGQTQSKKNSVEDHDVNGIVSEVAEVIKAKLKSQDLIR